MEIEKDIVSEILRCNSKTIHIIWWQTRTLCSGSVSLQLLYMIRSLKCVKNSCQTHFWQKTQKIELNWMLIEAYVEHKIAKKNFDLAKCQNPINNFSLECCNYNSIETDFQEQLFHYGRSFLCIPTQREQINGE